MFRTRAMSNASVIWWWMKEMQMIKSTAIRLCAWTIKSQSCQHSSTQTSSQSLLRLSIKSWRSPRSLSSLGSSMTRTQFKSRESRMEFLLLNSSTQLSWSYLSTLISRSKAQELVSCSTVNSETIHQTGTPWSATTSFKQCSSMLSCPSSARR